MCKFRLLNADEIDVKVKQVTNNGAVALLYKTSRTDMAILDETFGALNWTDDYREIKGNLYCGIGVRESQSDPFVWKWDCGIESREDEDGNEKKGEASDAFKRAGTKQGIGRELYSSPFIFLRVDTQARKDSSGKDVLKNNKPIYELADKFQTFSVLEIGYDDKRRINKLIIIDNHGKEVFCFGAKIGSRKQETGSTENHAKPENKKILTLHEAENMVLSLESGDILLKNLTLAQMERILKNDDFEKYHEAIMLILKFKAGEND